MKEVEFINSRVEGGGSESRTDDYPPTTGTGGASESTRAVSPSFTREERNAILFVLKNFTETLTIYRFALDDRVDGGDLGEIANEEDHRRRPGHRPYVSNFFEDLTKDVETNGSYDALIREIRDNREIQDDRVAVARNYTEARKTVAELRRLLEEERRENEREREESRARLVRSKNERKRLETKVDIESRYARAWEKARCEDISLRCGITLESLEDALGDLSSKEKNERRVDTEIEAFLDRNATANERAASQWRELYEREMRMYESGNGRLKEEIENGRRESEKLLLKYRERQTFIEKYLEEKEAAMERTKSEEHRRSSSIRIQAWWRGVMVRRKLGPYRPDERKKKRAVKSKK